MGERKERKRREGREIRKGKEVDKVRGRNGGREEKRWKGGRERKELFPHKTTKKPTSFSLDIISKDPSPSMLVCGPRENSCISK